MSSQALKRVGSVNIVLCWWPQLAHCALRLGQRGPAVSPGVLSTSDGMAGESQNL